MRFALLLLPGAFLSLASAQELIKSIPEDPKREAKEATVLQILQDANQMLSAKDTDGAMAKTNAALQLDPRSIAALVLRGAIYNQEKLWDKALNDYEAAHLIDPHDLIVEYDLAQINFAQKHYDAARPGFVALEAARNPDIADLAAYKVFLCDLFGGHENVASQELDAFNQAAQNPSYYFANVAWDVTHHKIPDARGWLTSATNIFPGQKTGFYASSLFDLGYLPLPPEL